MKLRLHWIGIVLFILNVISQLLYPGLFSYYWNIAWLLFIFSIEVKLVKRFFK